MAKVKNPLMSVSAAGSIGGIMYRSSEYGNIVSRRSIATVQRSPNQTLARARLSRAHKAFDLLTDSARAAWDAIATYPETGRNAWVRAYVRLAIFDLTPPSYPTQSQYKNELYDFLIYPFGTDVPRISILWSAYSYKSFPMIGYYVATYSNRETPNEKDYVIGGHTWDDWGELYIELSCKAPTVFLRLDVFNQDTMTVLKTIPITLHPTW